MFYMITDPVYADAMQISLSITYSVCIALSILFMSLCFYKSDLRYLKPSYAFLGINNLIGVMDLVRGDDPFAQEYAFGLRVIFNTVVFFFVNLYCINIKPYKYKNLELAITLSFLSISLCIGYRILDFSNIQSSATSLIFICLGSFFAFSFFKIASLSFDELFDEIKKNFML